MKFLYVADLDHLYMQWNALAPHGGEEVADGVVVHFDAENRVVGIEVEHASEKMDLTALELSGLPIERVEFVPLPIPQPAGTA